MNIIDVHHLSKAFELHILKDKRITALLDISFSMAEGEIIGLTGRSGSGKSSLMKCLYRTYIPSSGQIIYAARSGPVDLARAGDHAVIELRRSEIRYCSQFLSVIPRVSALDVVSEPLMRKTAGRNEALTVAGEMLEKLGLPRELWDAFPATFSGGEQQRINVARAIISRPRLLLIDEPTASLDTAAKDAVIDLIREMKGSGTAVLCISHDEYTLSRLADRCIHLQAGQLAAARENEDIEQIVYE